MKTVVSAVLCVSGPVTWDYHENLTDVFNACDRFQSQTGISFLTYRDMFIMGRPLSGISVPDGWAYRIVSETVHEIILEIFPDR